MGVGDATDVRELTIEMKVGFGVGGGAQLAAVIGDLAIEVQHDEILRLERGISYAAGLDAPEAGSAVDAGDIAPGELHQTGRLQSAVGMADFLFQGIEHGERERDEG